MLAFVEVCKVVGASFLVVLAADTVLRYAPGFNAASTRYNLLHALLNTYVVVSVVPDCYFVLANPLEAMSAPYSDVPLATTIGLHLFHCVSQYKSLTTVDWAHHLVSNMLVSFLCFPYDYGPLMQWGLLFICGLPGGIDYYLLTLVKLGTIAPSTEKRINRLLNTWIRAPGIVSCEPRPAVLSPARALSAPRRSPLSDSTRLVLQGRL